LARSFHVTKQFIDLLTIKFIEMATNQKNQMSGTRQQNQQNQGRSNTNSGNFANMDENKHREISSKGGKTSHSSNSNSRH
jgi:general stress protein YciG